MNAQKNLSPWNVTFNLRKTIFFHSFCLFRTHPKTIWLSTHYSTLQMCFLFLVSFFSCPCREIMVATKVDLRFFYKSVVESALCTSRASLFHSSFQFDFFFVENLSITIHLRCDNIVYCESAHFFFQWCWMHATWNFIGANNFNWTIVRCVLNGLRFLSHSGFRLDLLMNRIQKKGLMTMMMIGSP